jgi:ribosomal protein L44E
VAIKTKNQKQLTQANSNFTFIVNLKTTTLNTAQQWTKIRPTVATRQEKKANKPSPQKPTNKAAVRFKPTSCNRQRTQFQHKRPTKLKHKELKSKA